MDPYNYNQNIGSGWNNNYPTNYNYNAVPQNFGGSVPPIGFAVPSSNQYPVDQVNAGHNNYNPGQPQNPANVWSPYGSSGLYNQNPMNQVPYNQYTTNMINPQTNHVPYNQYPANITNPSMNQVPYNQYPANHASQPMTQPVYNQYAGVPNQPMPYQHQPNLQNQNIVQGPHDPNLQITHTTPHESGKNRPSVPITSSTKNPQSIQEASHPNVTTNLHSKTTDGKSDYQRGLDKLAALMDEDVDIKGEALQKMRNDYDLKKK